MVKYKKQLETLGPVRSEATASRDVKLPSVKKQIRKIEALEVPRGEERRVSAIVAEWKAAVRVGERNPYRLAIWWNARDPFTKIKKVTSSFGFKDCEDLR